MTLRKSSVGYHVWFVLTLLLFRVILELERGPTIDQQRDERAFGVKARFLFSGCSPQSTPASLVMRGERGPSEAAHGKRVPIGDEVFGAPIALGWFASDAGKILS